MRGDGYRLTSTVFASVMQFRRPSRLLSTFAEGLSRLPLGGVARHASFEVLDC